MPRRRRPVNDPPAPRPPATRREFLRALGAASALPLVGALPIAEAAAPAPPTPAAPVPTAAPADSTATVAAADARDLTEIVRRRFGARLTEAQLYEIRKDIEGSLDAARLLRDVPLQNADEPATFFRALPPEE